MGLLLSICNFPDLAVSIAAESWLLMPQGTRGPMGLVRGPDALRHFTWWSEASGTDVLLPKGLKFSLLGEAILNCVMAD